MRHHFLRYRVQEFFTRSLPCDDTLQLFHNGMTSAANSSNYFAVARNDDQQAIHSQEAAPSSPDEPEQLDTTSIRALRIAAAVERSKTEYRPEHAYTERLWLKPGSYKSQRPATNSQLDRQRLGMWKPASTTLTKQSIWPAAFISPTRQITKAPLSLFS